MWYCETVFFFWDSYDTMKVSDHRNLKPKVVQLSLSRQMYFTYWILAVCSIESVHFSVESGCHKAQLIQTDPDRFSVETCDPVSIMDQI